MAEETDGAATTGGARVEQAEATRRRILRAGRELFAERGYDASAVAEIASRAAVPKGLVFHYYPSKMQLLLAIIEDESPVAQISHLDISAVDGDVAATLRKVADSFHRSPVGSAEVRRIVLREASLHPEVREALAGLNQAAVSAVRAAIDAGLGPGSAVPAARRDAAAQALVAAGLHDLNLRQSTATSIDLPLVADVISAGLGA